MGFHDAATYNCDKELIKSLGLKEFYIKDANAGSPEQYLGTVKIKKLKIKVYCFACPAQFYRFVVGNLEFKTGSGCFTDKWNCLKPLFTEMAEEMMDIHIIKEGSD